MPTHRVAVTGATGFVGRHTVRELLRRGHRVAALARDVRKARTVLPSHDNLTVVPGNIFEPAALADLATECDACVHTIGILRERHGGITFRRMHVEATRAAIDACTAAQVRRFVHLSALGVSDEGCTAYQRSKWEAEQLVRRSGLEWTIFRPSLIHGHDGEFVQLVKGWASGRKPPYRFLPYFTRAVTDGSVPLGPTSYETPVVQPVWVGDVAAALAAALERHEAVGEVYHLAGPDAMPMPAMLTTLRDAFPGGDETLKPRGIPGDLAALAAGAAARIGMGGLLPFDEGMAIMGSEDSTANLDKARAHLGYNPRPFRQTAEAYAARA